MRNERGKKILIIGVEETERDSLLDMVMKGAKKNLPKLMTLAKLPSLSSAKDFTEVDEKRKKFYMEFEKLLQKEGNMVMSGNLVSRSPLGFIPLFTGDFFNKFTPDITVLLELDTRQEVMVPGYGIVQKKVDKKDVRIQQEFNRFYASLLFGTVKIFHVDRTNIKKTLKELKELFLSNLKE